MPGTDGLGQSVLEVPGVGFAGGICEGIAVCVVRIAAGRIRRQLVRRVVAVWIHAQRTQPIPYRVVAVALRGTTTLGYLLQLVNRVVAVIRRDPVEIVGLARPVAGKVIAVAGSVERRRSRLMQHAQEMRHRIVGVIRIDAVRPCQLRPPAQCVVTKAGPKTLSETGVPVRARV